MYYFITLLFLLTASKANWLYHNDLFWFGIDLVMIWCCIQRNRITLTDLNKLLLFAAGYIVFVFSRNFFFNHLSMSYIMSDINFLFKFVIFSFLFCITLRDLAVDYIIKVITHLSIISFLFYLVNLVNSDFILMIGNLVNFAPEIAPDGTVNLLIFNFHENFGIRNSGFCWEPGAYGSFLILALLLRFLKNNFVFDKTVITLILIMLTTISTTTYLALAIILFFYYRIRIGHFNIGFLFVLTIIVFLFIKVPFLNDKIVEAYNKDVSELEGIDNLIGWYDGVGKELPLNRFASVTFILSHFGISILWGISNKYAELFLNMYNVSISNGIADFCAKFGVIGLIYFCIQYVKFCRNYFLNFEHMFYCLLVLLLICFGEPILILPILLIFLFLYSYDTGKAENSVEQYA